MPDINITAQVSRAIEQARTTFNSKKEISPSSDRELRQMALDLQDKIKALSTAKASVLEFLEHHTANKANYS